MVKKRTLNTPVSKTDGKAYVWHRDTGALLEALPGHGEGSVNSVAWNPRHERMFASCSDDNTIRIWEPMVSDSSSDDVVADGALSSLVTGDSLAESHEKGKGKTRQQDQVSEETNVAVETRATSGSGSSRTDLTLFPLI